MVWAPFVELLQVLTSNWQSNFSEGENIQPTLLYWALATVYKEEANQFDEWVKKQYLKAKVLLLPKIPQQLKDDPRGRGLRIKRAPPKVPDVFSDKFFPSY
jgi:hypothetical protein